MSQDQPKVQSDPPSTGQAEAQSSLDSSNDSHSAGVFVHRPGIMYAQPLAVLFVVVTLSLAFCVTARFVVGGTRAPPALARFTTENPRLTAQLVAIIATALTAIVCWARGAAAMLYAQKRVRRSLPIFEIEVLSAIRYGAVVFTWRTKPMAMLGTALVVVTGGFLTSGFVALLSPFPIAKEIGFSIGGGVNTNLSITGELDFNSPLPACVQWLSDAAQRVLCRSGTCGKCAVSVNYPNSSFFYTTCNNQVSEVLSAARSSMLYRFASTIPREKQSNLLSAFTQLNDTRIIGTSSGTLPTGPSGVSVFSDSTFPKISANTASYNYTLQLQGTWATASCAYVEKSQSKIFTNPDIGGRLSWNITCPDLSLLPINSPLRNETKVHGLILAGACLSASSDNITIHLKSFANAQDYDSQIRPAGKAGFSYRKPRQSQTNQVYAGIDAMECTLVPRVGPVTAAFQTGLAAFNMTPSASGAVTFSSMGRLGRALTREAVYQTINFFTIAQSTMAGNSFGGLVHSVGISYADLDGSSRGDAFTFLVADALKGIFEYQATWLRLVYNGENPDAQCRIPVSGVLIEQSIGWHTGAQIPTIAALVPLLLTSLGSAIAIIWAMRMKGGLPWFDPTNTVSLIAATAVGKVEIMDRQNGRPVPVIGDPEDENVRSTEVRYEHHKGRWGLRSY